MYAHGDSVLEQHAERLYFELLKKRSAGYPLQYITGEQEFMSLVFEVTPDVLITQTGDGAAGGNRDRPLQAQDPGRREGVNMGEEAQASGKTQAGQGHSIEILDMCTGSGCIAVSLARYLPDCFVTAVDIIPGALEVAERNAKRAQCIRKGQLNTK